MINDKFEELCNEMPEYVFRFFAAKNDKYQPQTRIAYATDIRLFLQWLISSCPEKVTSTDIKDITLNELNKIDGDDIDDFMLYIEEYKAFNEQKSAAGIIKNSSRGKRRKLATLRVFFKFLLKKKWIEHNPTELTESPKIREDKAIQVLSEEQQKTMLMSAAKGSFKGKKGQTHRGIQKERTMRKKTSMRDVAILSFFLSTGVRVSELINIDIGDIDFNEQSAIVIRKGGSHDIVYFKEDTKEALLNYINLERNELLKKESDEEDDSEWPEGPLFVARGKKRMSVRRIQQLVKEYASFALPANQSASPHVLRKTFGTQVYRKFRDLTLAQNALGHKNSSTTSEYYVKFDKERLKELRQ